MSLILAETQMRSALHLKAVFFSLPWAEVRPPIFAFTWTEPEGGYSRQLTWTRLPEGFKHSPILFDETLHADLPACPCICLASKAKINGKGATEGLLQELQTLGYRMSAKKVTFVHPEVSHPGYQLKGGKRRLIQKPPFRSQLQRVRDKFVQDVLGVARYCCLWISEIAEMARP